jgi:hypothetical protein
MQKIDWKIFAPILLLILIAYSIWLQHWKDTGQMLNGLGKGRGKKQPPSPPQYDLFDNDGRAKDPDTTKLPTKIQLASQASDKLEKTLMYLKEARRAKDERVKSNFTRMAQEAQKKAYEKTKILNDKFQILNGKRAYI